MIVNPPDVLLPDFVHWFTTSELATVFAQGHTAVTSLYLGRLAVSSLHHPYLSPKTWAELFWTADQTWQGPVGIIQTLWGMFRMKRKVSLTFVLFAVTSLLALFTPTALNRAYPQDVEKVLEENIFTTVQLLDQRSMDTVRIGPQLAVGISGWTFGRDPYQIYPAERYNTHHLVGSTPNINDAFISTPISRPVGNPFFDAILPGLRLTRACIPVNTQQRPPSPDGMDVWCAERGLDARIAKHVLDLGGRNSLSLNWCTDFNAALDTDWMVRRNGHNMTIVAWISAVNTRSSVEEYFTCTSRTDFGNATVRVSYKNEPIVKEFERFNQVSLLIGDQSPTQMSFFPPVYAAFDALSQQFESSEDARLSADHTTALKRMLGYGNSSDPDALPNSSRLQRQLEDGAVYMAGAIQSVGAQTFNIKLLLSTVKTTMQRDQHWIKVAGTLLITWLTLLVFGTVRMYRRTFGSSLNSYTAVRLLVDMPHLVDGYCAGELIDNPKLRTPFERVGDGDPNNDYIGHISSGGPGVLDARRRYGAKSALPGR
jgi:hypothetical protein